MTTTFQPYGLLTYTAPKKTRAKKLSPTACLIAANISALSVMTHGELFRFAKEHGIDSRAGFSAYKKALAAAGIDYDALKERAATEKASALAARITHEVTLYSDAKARCQRFAICDRDGNVFWHGRFFDDDCSFSYGDRDEQSACECATARKAIWLASKVKDSIGATAIRLKLKVDAQWLCSLSGKAAILAKDAAKFGIELEMEWIPGTTNPADKWTTANGFTRWSDGNVAALAKIIA